MHIDTISTWDDFNRIRPDWDRLYASDADAQYFLSWSFLATYMRRFDGAWFVLAARDGPPGTPYAGLFPMRLAARVNQDTAVLTNELEMAGSYSADYTGLLAEPARERPVIAAFARHLRQMHWTKLNLENLRMSDRRRRFLLEALADPRLTVAPFSRNNPNDGIDLAACPVLALPDDFETYLAKQVSANMRQKLRRLLRKIEAGDGLEITEVSQETIERDCEILLEMWRVRWTPHKGDRIAGLIKNNRRLIRDAFAAGQLKLPVLWDRGRAVGALAFFLDPVKGEALFHMAGRDETYEEAPSGLILHAHSIRWAIENGYRRYDFMRGNEPYKYGFGPRDLTIHTLLVQTRTGRNLADRLDPRSLNTGFRAAKKFHEQGELDKAERLYRQVLDTEPDHARTLYGLGQIVSARGNHDEAAGVYRRLTELAPNSIKALARLAVCLQSAARFEEAAEAFARLLDINPGQPAARYGYARCLAEIGRQQDANRIFAELASCDDEQIRQKARRQAEIMALSTLAPAIRLPATEPAVQARSTLTALAGLLKGKPRLATAG